MTPIVILNKLDRVGFLASAPPRMRGGSKNQEDGRRLPQLLPSWIAAIFEDARLWASSTRFCPRRIEDRIHSWALSSDLPQEQQGIDLQSHTDTQNKQTNTPEQKWMRLQFLVNVWSFLQICSPNFLPFLSPCGFYFFKDLFTHVFYAYECSVFMRTRRRNQTLL